MHAYIHVYERSVVYGDAAEEGDSEAMLVIAYMSIKKLALKYKQVCVCMYICVYASVCVC